MQLGRHDDRCDLHETLAPVVECGVTSM
jgi:hypothetical protein